MRKILSVISLSIFVFTLIACGQKAIDGVYEGKGGKVGIYEMKTMIVEKASDGSKFKVTFSGAESTLTYDNVEFQDGELKISDKGLMMPVKIDGLKATVQLGGAVFEKTENPIPKVAETVKTPEPVQAAVPAVTNKAVYPETLIGKWAGDNGEKSCVNAIEAEKQTGMWDGLEIQKDGISGMEFSCTVASVSGSEGSFTVMENCSSQGEEYKQTNVYKINSKSLQVMTDSGSGNKSQASFRLCK